jgi:hypothetical protein
MTNFIDAGLFLLMLGMAFLFMFLGYKRIQGDKLFQLIAFLLFIICALILVSEYQVAWTETITDPDGKTWTDYKPLIATNGSWIGWIFVILALANIILFIVWHKQDKDEKRRMQEEQF